MANFLIYDQRGKLIKQSMHLSSANQSAYIDLTGVAKGIYVLKMIAGKEVKAEKLIVQ